MNFIVGVFDRVTRCYQWFFDNSTSISGNKRKRSCSDFNENLSPNKKLKLLNSQTQTDNFIRGPFDRYTSRGEKIQSMTNLRKLYSPSVKTSLRPPSSWNLAMNNEVIEFSSDEDDDVNNDVQVIGEEPPRNRNPLSSLPVENGSSRDNGVQVIKVIKKDNNLGDSGSQLQISFRTSTPAGASHRRNGHSSSTLNAKKNCSLSSIKDRSIERPKMQALNMTIQLESKQKYGALLKSYLGQSSIASSTSSFANLRDVEKTFRAHCNSNIKSKHHSAPPSVKVIDLVDPKEKRKATRIPVKPAPSKHNDDDSDVEIVSVTPVPRVNSYEEKLRSCKYMLPGWIENLQASLKNITEEAARQTKEHQLRKNIYAKHNKEQLDAVEERVRRHLAITDTIVLDEVVEDEKLELPELTPEMEERIKKALVPTPANEVIAEGFSLRITRSDMQTLAHLNWLNDEVINFYMNLLIERGKREKMPKVYAFNTFFLKALNDRGHAGVRRWTRKIDIFAHDLIIVPVHLGLHWCVAIIDFREKVIEYYDSMGNRNDRCLNTLRSYIEAESLDKKNTPYDTSSWKLIFKTDIPQQMNGSDCGMFSCTFAEYRCRNAKITFTQENMPYFRRKMVYEILTGKLMIDNN